MFLRLTDAKSETDLTINSNEIALVEPSGSATVFSLRSPSNMNDQDQPRQIRVAESYESVIVALSAHRPADASAAQGDTIGSQAGGLISFWGHNTFSGFKGLVTVHRSEVASVQPFGDSDSTVCIRSEGRDQTYRVQAHPTAFATVLGSNFIGFTDVAAGPPEQPTPRNGW